MIKFDGHDAIVNEHEDGSVSIVYDGLNERIASLIIDLILQSEYCEARIAELSRAAEVYRGNMDGMAEDLAKADARIAELEADSLLLRRVNEAASKAVSEGMLLDEARRDRIAELEKGIALRVGVKYVREKHIEYLASLDDDEEYGWHGTIMEIATAFLAGFFSWLSEQKEYGYIFAENIEKDARVAELEAKVKAYREMDEAQLRHIDSLEAKLALSKEHTADLRAQNATLMSDLNASRQRDKARF